ncbi:MAG: phosphoglycerate kinase [Pirellulales bacterium]|nr:phosphoglycerate kinase [Pirellulales bacterium]
MAKITADDMTNWCRRLLGAEPFAADQSLAASLAAIPRLESLADLPAGTVVLVRGDVDAKPGAKVGEGDIRLRSMVDTLRFGIERGWKQVVFGHIGRKPEGTLKAVRDRMSQLLDIQISLLEDWLDPATHDITDVAASAIRSAPTGSVLLLENTRKYDIERALWKAKPDDLGKLAGPLAALANNIAAKIGTVYVNEALSAGSLDASSTVVPATMERVALGKYVASEFEGPMTHCLNADLVVFSGLKIDKLDDLEAMVRNGRLKMVIAAGSLAMALKKAAARLSGAECNLGVAENSAHSDKPYYIPPERVEQAFQMLEEGRRRGIDFVLPVDFVLADGRVAEQLGPNDQQLDIGPKTIELFHNKVGVFIDEAKNSKASGGQPAVAFHNGVFGMFEDSRFEEGTRRFMQELKRMKEAGVAVYVGGGEGGAALEKYGKSDWVTHVFTAGGTVLNVLGHEPVPYLVALRMAAEQPID